MSCATRNMQDTASHFASMPFHERIQGGSQEKRSFTVNEHAVTEFFRFHVKRGLDGVNGTCAVNQVSPDPPQRRFTASIVML